MCIRQLYHRTAGLTTDLCAYLRRIRLYNTDFSIIANNCWAGYIYQYIGLAYTSPDYS